MYIQNSFDWSDRWFWATSKTIIFFTVRQESLSDTIIIFFETGKKRYDVTHNGKAWQSKQNVCDRIMPVNVPINYVFVVSIVFSIVLTITYVYDWSFGFVVGTDIDFICVFDLVFDLCFTYDIVWLLFYTSLFVLA